MVGQHPERKIMKHRIWLAAFATLLATGCATAVPEARTFPPGRTEKGAFRASLGSDRGGRRRTHSTSAYACRAAPGEAAVRRGPRADGFRPGFPHYMVTGLVNAGLPVAAHPQDAVEIQYETQVVRHADFDPLAAGYKPGTATAGVTGFWVLRDAFRTWPSASTAAVTIAGAAGWDTYRGFNPGETGVELHHDIGRAERPLRDAKHRYLLHRAYLSLNTPSINHHI